MMDFFLEIFARGISVSWVLLAVLLLRFLMCRCVNRRRIVLLWAIVGIRLLLPGTLPVRASVNEAGAFATMLVKNLANNSAAAVSGGGFSYYLSRLQMTVDNDAVETALAVLAVIWYVVVLGMAVVSIAAGVRVKREIAGLEEIRAGVYASRSRDRSFLFGLHNPVIVLGQNVRASDRALIIEHEKEHQRCGDHYFKLVAYALRTVFWFSPLIWWGYHCFCEDLEMACDEEIALRMDLVERKDFARVVLDLETAGSSSPSCFVNFGEAPVKRRIETILNAKKQKKAAFGVFAALLVLLTVFSSAPGLFVTNPAVRDGGGVAMAGFDAAELAVGENGQTVFRDPASSCRKFIAANRIELTALQLRNFLPPAAWWNLSQYRIAALNDPGSGEIEKRIVLFYDIFENSFH